jgi:glycosyltransferase involved in cell wall biosynthesis
MHAVKMMLQPDEGRAPLESVHDNVFWAGCAPRVSIVIPSYRHDASTLIDALARCTASPLSEIIVYDDGSRDHNLLAQMQAAAGSARAAIRIVSSPVNRGPAAARNAAIAHARAAWILLLDADMSPDSMSFLEAYLDAEEQLEAPSVVVGGHSLRFAPRDKAFALQRWHERPDCLAAEERRKAPGRYVFSSNILVHRDVLKACPFDEGFAGWGWEGLDWGLKVEARFPVMHIDNPATHLGLESDRALMARYAASGANFARFVWRHPEHTETMSLYRAVVRARRLPFRKLFRAVAGGLAASRLLPTALRGRALKAWRALVYAEAL